MKKLFVKCMNLLCKFSMQCKIKKRLIPFVMCVCLSFSDDVHVPGFNGTGSAVTFKI